MLTHFNLVANACQSVMGHPDIQICGENEGETGLVLVRLSLEILPKTYAVLDLFSMIFCDSKQKALAVFEIIWSFLSIMWLKCTYFFLLKSSCLCGDYLK